MSVLVKKGNSERVIAEEKLPEFLKMGYSHIDKNGKVIKKGEAQTASDLRAAYADVVKENEALTKQTKELSDELDAAKKENETLKEQIELLKNGGKFKCPHCDKEYTTQAALDKHIKEKHPDAIENSVTPA